jgi:hypothetical protein
MLPELQSLRTLRQEHGFGVGSLAIRLVDPPTPLTLVGH